MSRTLICALLAAAPLSTAWGFVYGPQVAFDTGVEPLAIASGDLDGDGRADLAVSTYHGLTLEPLINGTPAFGDTPSFVASGALALDNYGQCVAIRDVNADGRADLLACAATTEIANGCGAVGVFLNTTPPGTSPPTFTARTNFTVGNSPEGVALADFNDDGNVDFAAVNQNRVNCPADFSVSPYFNATAEGSLTPLFDDATVFAASFSPTSIAAGDLNSDGAPDLVVGVRGEASSSVAVFLNTTPPLASTATWAARVDLPTGAGGGGTTIGAVLADINGDDLLDLVVSNSSSDQVSVFLNQTPLLATTVTFGARTDFSGGPMGDEYPAIAVADLDGDDRPDVVVTNAGSNTVQVFGNTTANGATVPSFASPQPYATGSHPLSVAIDDLNGDGRPDLAVANYLGNSVSVLLAEVADTPTPTWTPLEMSTATPTPTAIPMATATASATPSSTSTATPEPSATATDTPTESAASCPASPATGCLTSAKGVLQITDASDDRRDRLTWRFYVGPPLMQQDFGDPRADASFALCVYVDGALALPGGVPTSPTLWAPIGTRGYRYRDVAGSSDGVTTVRLVGGAAGRSKLQVKGKGVNVQLPAPASATQFFTANAAVVVQLRELNGECYETAFGPSQTIRNDGARFKAKY